MSAGERDKRGPSRDSKESSPNPKRQPDREAEPGSTRRISARVVALIVVLLAVAIVIAGGLAVLLTRGGHKLQHTGPAAARTDWPTSLHDLGRTAASADTHISVDNASSLQVAWTLKTGGPVAATPTVTGGVAYVGSWDGYEYAVNTATGGVIWKTYLGVTHYKPICIPPVIGVSSPSTLQNGVLYLGGGDSYWYALDAKTGGVLWKVYVGKSTLAGGNYNWAAPLIYKGYAYIGVASLGDCPLVQGKLMKVDLRTHQVVNTLAIVPNGQLGGGIWTSPALDTETGTIYVSTGTKNLPTQHMAQAVLAIDPVTLEIEDHWELPNSETALDADFGTSTTLFTNAGKRRMLALTNKNGLAYGLPLNDLSGGPAWEREITKAGACPTCGDGSVSSGAFGGGRLYLAGGNGQIGAQGYPGTVNALDPSTGRLLWQHGASGLVIGALAYANGLVFASAGSVFEVLDAANGHTLYAYDTGAQIYAGPSVSDGYVYTANTAGEVFAFRVGTPIVPTSDGACPARALCQDVGAVAIPGKESLAGGVWAVGGSGGGLTSTADSFRSISYPNTTDGNVQITAEVRSLPKTGINAQAGIALRQSNAPGAPSYSVMVKPNGRLLVQTRPRIGSEMQTIISSKTLGRLPVYVMINRLGNTLQAATSKNGKVYALLPGSDVDLVLPVTSLAGLAVSSSVNSKLGSATFAHVTVSSPRLTVRTPSIGSRCPRGWSCADVGNPQLVGQQVLAGATWTVKGSGADIWNAIDQFRFISKEVRGNGTVSTRVVGIPGGTKNPAKSGVMLRLNTNRDAAYYAAYMTTGGKVQIQYRDVSGYAAQQIGTAPAAFPQYVRIARSGTTFTTYLSRNGRVWSPVPRSSISLPALAGPIRGGLAFTSHNAYRVGSTTVDRLQVGRGAPVPPNVCPRGWQCQDVGFPTPTGDQRYADGAWTLYSGGGDIFDTYDQFHMVSRELTGDGSLSARVASQESTGEWAKAGPMLRVSSDPQAPYYAAFVTPGHGLVAQWRAGQGAATGQSPKTTAKAPVYLRITRKGTTFSTSLSTNGTKWTLVPGTTTTIAALSGTVLAGLASNSYNAAVTNTTTWDHVFLNGTGGRKGIPAPWTATAVGSPTPAGSVSYRNFAFRVNGGGIDMHGAVDQSEYVYQTVTGDGELVARLTSQTRTNPLARAGLMFKESPSSGSAYAAVMITPGNGARFQSSLDTDERGLPYSLPDGWLKLTREGSLITGFQSRDGTNWHEIGHVVLNLPLSATVGMFVNAHSGGTSLATAAFDNVSYTPTGGGALPAPWTSVDVGRPGLPGSTSYNENILVGEGDGFTLKGAGRAVGAARDDMHFAYRALDGDGTIVAKLVSLDNTDPWAEAGLMFRAAPRSGSAFAALSVTTGNGVHMQFSPRGDIRAGTYRFPDAWLKLKRTGNVFTAYRSTDGKKWRRVASARVRLPASALIGLFVNAHHAGTTLATARFGFVAITKR